MWDAIAHGKLGALLTALAAGGRPGVRNEAGRLPIESLDAFTAHDAAIAALALAMLSDDFSLDIDPRALDHLECGLLLRGFRCGSPKEDETVGMHELPPTLYPLYERTAEKFGGLDSLMRTGAIRFENGEWIGAQAA